MAHEITKYVLTPELGFFPSIIHLTECLSSLHQQYLLEAYDSEDS